jgi:hypothetical protein
VELIVFLVRANPEPVVMTIPLTSQRAIAPTNLDGKDRAFFTKPERGMPGVRLKQGEIFICELLDMRGESLVASPERPQRM